MIRFECDYAEGAAPQLLERLTRTNLEQTPGYAVDGHCKRARDLIRAASDGEGMTPHRVGVADERGELGVGSLRAFLGPRVDVLAYCPKAAALGMLLRGMSPQVLAADEITDPQDIRAMEQAAGCGVGLLATIHAADAAELTQRPLYRQLLAEKVFRLAVRIRRDEAGRTYEVEELPW